MNNEALRIVFMGTPEFAVPSLELLLKNKFNVVGVVTVPDKPAGRGLQLQQSAVKKFAVEHKLTVLQPEKLKDENFIRDLSSLKANLQIVVAFRMLPEVVWQMPALGTFNLHGSLLPQYRGAAPINWAVMNGEKETGVTTFFLQHAIDTGKIIHAAKCAIEPNDTAGSMHDKLMVLGAELVVKTANDILSGTSNSISQEQLYERENELKHAPKIHKVDCKVNWNIQCESIVNKVRGLCPFPAAYAEITDETSVQQMKLFECKAEVVSHKLAIGNIQTDTKTYLKVAAKDGFVHVLQLQLAGKKRMPISDFLRGFQFLEKWKFTTTDV